MRKCSTNQSCILTQQHDGGDKRDVSNPPANTGMDIASIAGSVLLQGMPKTVMSALTKLAASVGDDQNLDVDALGRWISISCLPMAVDSRIKGSAHLCPELELVHEVILFQVAVHL